MTLLISAPHLTAKQASVIGTLTHPYFGYLTGKGFGYPTNAFALYVGRSPCVPRIQHSINIQLPILPCMPRSDLLYGWPYSIQLVDRYRKGWMEKVKAARVKVTGLEPELSEVAAAMASCLPGADGLQKKLLALLVENDHQQRMARSADPDAVVVEATLALTRQNVDMLYAGEIAAKCNHLLKDRGERFVYSPAKIGRALRRLSLPTRRLSARGNGLQLDRVTLDRIEQLAMMYAVEDAIPQIATSSGAQLQEIKADQEEV